MKHEPIENYILKSQAERQEHLRLDEECTEIGGYDSREYRGLLAYFLNTTIPTKKKVVLCHACNNHKCSNPKHLYWGTYAENVRDAVNCGSMKTIYENTLAKYGDSTREFQRRAGSAGGKGNRSVPKSPEHRRKISEALKKKSIGL